MKAAGAGLQTAVRGLPRLLLAIVLACATTASGLTAQLPEQQLQQEQLWAPYRPAQSHTRAIHQTDPTATLVNTPVGLTLEGISVHQFNDTAPLLTYRKVLASYLVGSAWLGIKPAYERVQVTQLSSTSRQAGKSRRSLLAGAAVTTVASSVEMLSSNVQSGTANLLGAYNNGALLQDLQAGGVATTSLCCLDIGGVYYPTPSQGGSGPSSTPPPSSGSPSSDDGGGGSGLSPMAIGLMCSGLFILVVVIALFSARAIRRSRSREREGGKDKIVVDVVARAAKRHGWGSARAAMVQRLLGKGPSVPPPTPPDTKIHRSSCEQVPGWSVYSEAPVDAQQGSWGKGLPAIVAPPIGGGDAQLQDAWSNSGATPLPPLHPVASVPTTPVVPTTNTKTRSRWDSSSGHDIESLDETVAGCPYPASKGRNLASADARGSLDSGSAAAVGSTLPRLGHRDALESVAEDHEPHTPARAIDARAEMVSPEPSPRQFTLPVPPLAALTARGKSDASEQARARADPGAPPGPTLPPLVPARAGSGGTGAIAPPGVRSTLVLPMASAKGQMQPSCHPNASSGPGLPRASTGLPPLPQQSGMALLLRSAPDVKLVSDLLIEDMPDAARPQGLRALAADLKAHRLAHARSTPQMPTAQPAGSQRVTLTPLQVSTRMSWNGGARPSSRLTVDVTSVANRNGPLFIPSRLTPESPGRGAVPRADSPLRLGSPLDGSNRRARGGIESPTRLQKGRSNRRVTGEGSVSNSLMLNSGESNFAESSMQSATSNVIAPEGVKETAKVSGTPSPAGLQVLSSIFSFLQGRLQSPASREGRDSASGLTDLSRRRSTPSGLSKTDNARLS